MLRIFWVRLLCPLPQVLVIILSITLVQWRLQVLYMAYIALWAERQIRKLLPIIRSQISPQGQQVVFCMDFMP